MGVTVQTGRRVWQARAEITGPGERPALWREMLERNKYLPKVEHKAGRELPLVRLRPR